MNAEEYLKAGDSRGALAALQDTVRRQPAETKLRVFLFQLLAVEGQWERALNQLQVFAEMDVELRLRAHAFRALIQCEAVRQEVFEGKRTPVVFGEPEPWMGKLIQANQLLATGQVAAAGALRAQAFEEAPAVGGQLDGAAFEWIGDADSRLGPMLEVMVEGRYCWAPWSRVRRVEIQAPTELADFVWCPALFLWTNGGEAAGFVPTRYPGTERSEDAGLRLARRTDWQSWGEDGMLGLGQRVLVTNETEKALLDARRIEVGEAAG